MGNDQYSEKEIRAMAEVIGTHSKPLMQGRPARLEDIPAIVAIYNQGIEDRVATFETRLRTDDDIRAWFDGKHTIIVVEVEQEVIAFASTSAYRNRECYAGIAECSAYVKRDKRGQGGGRLALQTLIDAAEQAGYWKLVSRIFVENSSSRALVRSCGFREVGVYYKHAQLDGVWRDVVIVERLLPANLKEKM
jgi:L-amino acid N-acyltransferase YncA